MAKPVADAIDKLMQFGSHTHPERPVSRADLTPVLTAVALALSDLDKRLGAASGKP